MQSLQSDSSEEELFIQAAAFQQRLQPESFAEPVQEDNVAVVAPVAVACATLSPAAATDDTVTRGAEGLEAVGISVMDKIIPPSDGNEISEDEKILTPGQCKCYHC